MTAGEEKPPANSQEVSESEPPEEKPVANLRQVSESERTAAGQEKLRLNSGEAFESELGDGKLRKIFLNFLSVPREQAGEEKPGLNSGQVPEREHKEDDMGIRKPKQYRIADGSALFAAEYWSDTEQLALKINTYDDQVMVVLDLETEAGRESLVGLRDFVSRIAERVDDEDVAGETT